MRLKNAPFWALNFACRNTTDTSTVATYASYFLTTLFSQGDWDPSSGSWEEKDRARSQLLWSRDCAQGELILCFNTSNQGCKKQVFSLWIPAKSFFFLNKKFSLWWLGKWKKAKGGRKKKKIASWNVYNCLTLSILSMGCFQTNISKCSGRGHTKFLDFFSS